MDALNFSDEFSCENTRRLLNALLHGELDEEQCDGVKAHLLHCHRCAYTLGDAFAKAISADEEIAEFLGRGEGRKVLFELVNSPAITPDGELHLTMRASVLWEVVI